MQKRLLVVSLIFIESNPPTVAILNANHNKPSGISVTRRLNQNLPNVSVILTMEESDTGSLFFSALKSGASACLTKSTDPEDLVNIIREVAQGRQPISEAILRPEIASQICTLPGRSTDDLHHDRNAFHHQRTSYDGLSAPGHGSPILVCYTGKRMGAALR